MPSNIGAVCLVAMTALERSVSVLNVTPSKAMAMVCSWTWVAPASCASNDTC